MTTCATCTGPECDKPVKSKGMCDSHRQQVARGSPLTPLGRQKHRPEGAPVQLCVGPECDLPVKVWKRMLCSTHNNQVLRGLPLTPRKKRLGSLRPVHSERAGWRTLPEFENVDSWCGTAGGYVNHKCRCALCVIAWNAYSQ